MPTTLGPTVTGAGRGGPTSSGPTRRPPRLRAATLALVAALAASPFHTPGIARASAGERCEDVNVPVTLPNRPHPVAIRGTLCGPAGRGVQVLLAGGTYGRAYWDLPYRPEIYSYVRALSVAGWATLNLDRLGIGASDDPPASEVTLDVHAEVVHQVVQAARAGRIGGRAFKQVFTVGNSMGAYIALLEAAKYDDVDGVISTGHLNSPRIGVPAVLASLYPAQAESRFAHLPPGYLTTRPNTRGSLFYAAAQAEPKTIEIDEATKETLTTGEMASAGPESDHEMAARVRAPVLSVIGEFDNIFCARSCADPGGPAYQERAYFPNAACFRMYVVAGSGHVINLHTSAPEWFAVAREWLERVEHRPIRSPSC
jgi:pimeloyl-ACP methyl ester carboxylesterase